jgi:hypothetical protein
MQVAIFKEEREESRLASEHWPTKGRVTETRVNHCVGFDTCHVV